MRAADAVWVGAAPINDPVDPVSYATWVPIVGGGLLVLLAAWVAWVMWRTRNRPWRESEGGRGDRYGGLRSQTLAHIDAAEERFRTGASDLRTLHLDLNHLLREFANGRLRMDTSSLTVSELATLEGTDRLTSLLTDYAEPAFAIDSDAEALQATGDARAVVSQW